MSANNENGISDLIVRPHHTAVSVADFESARDFFYENHRHEAGRRNGQ